MAYKIFLSPSNQTGNKYAYGDTNEAAECGKMAAAAEAALKRCGFEVKTMQWESIQVRCEESQAWGANLHIPIHTNAFNGSVSGTRTMVYAKTGARYEAAKAIHNRLAAITPGTSENISEQPQLYECRKPDNVPSVYLEVDFHDVPKIAKWLIENPQTIGEAICQGVCDYFKVAYVAPEQPEKKIYRVQVGAYTAKENAEAMVTFLKQVGVAGFITEN